MIRISNPVLFKKYVRQVFMQDGRNTKKLRSPRIKTKRMERDSIIDSQADEELGSILANDLREVIEQIWILCSQWAQFWPSRLDCWFWKHKISLRKRNRASGDVMVLLPHPRRICGMRLEYFSLMLIGSLSLAGDLTRTIRLLEISNLFCTENGITFSILEFVQTEIEKEERIRCVSVQLCGQSSRCLWHTSSFWSFGLDDSLDWKFWTNDWTKLPEFSYVDYNFVKSF